MPTLIVIGGLPASGKSTLIKNVLASRVPELKALVGDVNELGIVEHDYMSNAVGNSEQLNRSRHLQQLLQSLQQNKNCIIADVVFVREDRQRELADLVKLSCRDVQIVWVIFQNNWKLCVGNSVRREDDPAEFRRQADLIVSLTRRHNIPRGAIVMDVFEPPRPSERALA